MNQQEAFDQLISDAHDGSLAVFCGAGISLHSGIPIVYPFLEELYTNLGLEGEEKEALLKHRQPFEKIMQLFLENFGEATETLLWDAFDNKLNSLRPAPSHHWLADLAKQGKVQLICTTNFDTLIEQALDEAGVPYEVYARDKPNSDKPDPNPNPIAPHLKPFAEVSVAKGKVALVKIHGTIDERKEMVITIESIAREERLTERENFIRTMFEAKAMPHTDILIVGYSCSDAFDIVPAWKAMGRSGRSECQTLHYLNYTKKSPQTSPQEIKTITDLNQQKQQNLTQQNQEGNNPFRDWQGSHWYLQGNFDEWIGADLSLLQASEGALKRTLKRWKERVKNYTDAIKTSMAGGPEFLIARLFHDAQGLGEHNDIARKYYSLAEGKFRQSKNRAMVASSLNNQAAILQRKGKLEEAMALNKEEEKINKELGNQAGLASSLGNRALILKDWGKLEEAMTLHKEEEKIKRELGNQAGLASSLGNQALILKDWGQLEEAMTLHKEEEKIKRELGNQAGLANSLNNQALILRDWGKLEEAMVLHKEVDEIFKELGNQAGLASSLGNQALILQRKGKLEEAMALHKEEDEIFKELGYQAGLANSLGNQALILKNWGRLEEAMTLYKEVEKVFKELGNQAGLANSLNNQALILRDWGQLEEAMALHKEVDEIFKELGNQAGLAFSLGNQALILQRKGKLEEAMALHKEEEKINKELGYQAGLASSLGNQALILKDWGRLEEAMTLYKEVDEIFKELGYQAGLANSLGNQATILKDWGRLEEAMTLYKEVEKINKALGYQDGLMISWFNQAMLIVKMEGSQKGGSREEALNLLYKAEAVAKQLESPHLETIQEAIQGLRKA